MFKIISLSLSILLLSSVSFADSSVSVTTVTTLPASDLYTRSNGQVVVKVVSPQTTHHQEPESELYHRRPEEVYVYDEPLDIDFYYDSGYRQGYWDARYRRHYNYHHHW